MSVKDVYGKEVSEQNHMVFAHNPLSHLIKNMSDREIMNAKYGTYTKEKKVEHILGKDIRHMPNQKWHQIVSFIKSGVRILGYLLIPFSLPIAAGVLIFSEIIGIIEELV